MPLYEFYCPICDFTEVMVCPVDERNLQTCERCHVYLARKLTAPSFSVKGFNAENGYSDHKTTEKLQ